MAKRTLPFLLAVVLILSLFPARALAAERSGNYQIGDTVEVAGTAAPDTEIPEHTKWEQQGDATEKTGTEPICGKVPHTHGETAGCNLQCTLQEHTHTANCPADCALHVHSQDCCKAVHVHGTGCNCQTEAHSHSVSCYTNCAAHTCDETCQIPAGGICSEIHSHSASCVPACGKEAHSHSDICCTARHQHSESCVPGCGQEGHTHITDGCGGEGVCTTAVHTHNDGNCRMECTLEVHEHGDGCYERIPYTTWKLVEDAALFTAGNICTTAENHIYATDLETNEHLHALSLAPGQTRNVVFFYGTPEGWNMSLSMDNLRPDSDIFFQPSNRGMMVGPQYVGTRNITFSGSDGTFVFPVISTMADYAFFSQPIRDAQYMVSGYKNAAGKTVSLNLLWAENCQKPTSITATSGSTAVTVTADFTRDGYIPLSFPAPQSGSVTFQLNSLNESLATIILEDLRITADPSQTHLITLDYKGTPITVGFGISQDYIRLNTDGGSRFPYEATYPYDQYYTFYLGALKNFGAHEEEPAPQSFYDAVSNVSIVIESFQNLSGNSTICNGSFQETHSTDVTVDNIRTRGNTLLMPAKKLFTATLAMSFDYAGTTHTLKLPFTFDSADVPLEATDLDTAQELNAILASSEALMNWFEATDKAAYDRFIANHDGFIDIYLPNVSYERPIVSNISPTGDSPVYYNCVRLHAHPDGTSLPGLTTAGGIFALFGLDFVAPEGMGGTCGILAEGGSASNTLSAVIGCTFTGYEYGIRSTATGHVAQVSTSTFTNCNNAIYVDCTKNPVVQSDTMYYYRNTFLGSKFAITIRNHPAGCTPYATCAFENNFIGCNKDFKITTPGNPHYYHFTRNYFGNKGKTRSADYTSRTVAIDTEGSSNAILVTNPRMVSYYDNYETDPVLGIDDTPGLHSMIFNSESGSYKLDGDALGMIQNKTAVHLLDNAENTIATWIFGGEDE